MEHPLAPRGGGLLGFNKSLITQEGLLFELAGGGPMQDCKKCI